VTAPGRDGQPIHRNDTNCPHCGAFLAEAARCPSCGRWLRLPANPFLEGLSEEPAMAAPHARESFPWLELSPSFGLVLAIVVILIGVQLSTLVVPLAGAIMAIGSFAWAAVLELQISRRVAREQGDPAAMNMLPYSSDWPAVRGARRRG
jgi:hypothetical protein